MDITRLSIDGYEDVVHFADTASGLNAIISIHNTNLGPALGGCRMYPYDSFEAALQDVMRLSKGMTYKNALADIPFGGGKAVIIGDPSQKSNALFHAFGDAVDHLGGRYYTAEDVGTSVADIELAGERTEYVSGTHLEGHGSGDPSPFTAMGVFLGIREAVRFKLNRPTLKGVSVIVMGLGKVGMELCRLLHDAGAELIVSDINIHAQNEAVEKFGAQAAHYQEAFAKQADVYAPCALGGAINSVTLPLLQVSIVAGAANNQLQAPRFGQALFDRDILYAPDYVINAGGVMSVAHEVSETWCEEDVITHIHAIPPNLAAHFLPIPRSQ